MKIRVESNDEIKTYNISFIDMLKIALSVNIVAVIILWFILFLIGIFIGVMSLMF